MTIILYFFLYMKKIYDVAENWCEKKYCNFFYAFT